MTIINAFWLCTKVFYSRFFMGRGTEFLGQFMWDRGGGLENFHWAKKLPLRQNLMLFSCFLSFKYEIKLFGVFKAYILKMLSTLFFFVFVFNIFYLQIFEINRGGGGGEFERKQIPVQKWGRVSDEVGDLSIFHQMGEGKGTWVKKQTNKQTKKHNVCTITLTFTNRCQAFFCKTHLLYYRQPEIDTWTKHTITMYRFQDR